VSSHPTTPSDARRKPVTLHRLREMHAAGEKIAMLTAYDAGIARLLDECGVDSLLVGDSLGMIQQGHASTLPVTLDEMAYHVRCVARGVTQGSGAAWLIADLPFGSYQQGPEQAMRSSAALMQAGAQMVKLEGGGWSVDTVRFLVERGVPVCGHLGLTPQSVHALGGYRVQGRDDVSAQRLAVHARELADAGAAMLVLELVPGEASRRVREACPELLTIGIGAGSGCSGQVLVVNDMLGITRGKLPRFVRNFLSDGGGIDDAIRRYVAAVKDGSFPDDTVHGYT
jgi:3-methyl-2-oxobutanoate hydroxymethyltransferase